MRTNLPHTYGMTIKDHADRKRHEYTCTAATVDAALRTLHKHAQKVCGPDDYEMVEFWEEYPINIHGDTKRSAFDLPKGPNPRPIEKPRAQSSDAGLFSAEELKACDTRKR